MSRARDFADLAGSADAGGLTGRNLIINGAMQVAQRGTSFDTLSSPDFCTDRWRITFAGLDGNVDADQTTTVPTGQGFANSLQIHMDASETSLDAADQINVHQRLEGQDLQQLAKGTSSAKKTVCSFWVRSSVASTYTLELQDSDNNRSISKTYTIDAADTWEKKEVVFDGDTTGTLNNDSGRSMDVRWWIDAGSNFTSGTLATSWATTTSANRVSATTGWLESTSPEFYLTGVQWELGEQATPFEHRSMGDELARCQRYFFNPMAGGNGQSSQISFHSMLNMGGSVSTGNNGHLAFHVPFPVSMRAAPTLTHDLANTKIVTSAPSGTEVAFYIQNQGYRPKAGNGNLNTLSRATGTSAGCVVGTYYISPDNLKGDQINIGASNQFHFSAEL